MNNQNITVDEQDDVLCIENEYVKVLFDLKDGLYRAESKNDGAVIIEEARVAVDGHCSGKAGMEYTWSSEEIADEIGNGRMAKIICRESTGDEILLGIILYEGEAFISLRCGFKNAGDRPVQIQKMAPLSNGQAYRGFAGYENVKILDGNSGAFQTEILREGKLKSRNNAMLTFGREFDTHTLVLGGLTYRDFAKYAYVELLDENEDHYAVVSLTAEDPHGKRVDGGDVYFPDRDTFVINYETGNPFLALEEYGKLLGTAQNAHPNSYQFPSVCLWYAEFYDMQNHSNQKLNTTAGAVTEMQHIEDTNFLNYAPVAVRLVPDYYGKDHKGGNTQQGWWDDEHWQRYQDPDEGNGKYEKPYETTQKWAQAVENLGGIPLTYFQASAVSEDYAKTYPEQMLFNRASCNTGEWLNGSYTSEIGYDFTDKDFIRHMEAVYQNLKSGGVKGLMFDYPGTAWDAQGGFDDPYATTAGNYINVFRLAKEGLGKDSFVHERGIETGHDITLGWVDSQRTEDDTADMPPEMVKKIGLRWYKNRVVTNYDMDSKDLKRAQSPDELHTLVTMAYAVSGRLLLANGFENLDKDTLFALSRTYPQHKERKSFRPVDAFTGKSYPQVYDYEVNQDWHQVIFYNGDRSNSAVIKTCFSGDTAFGGLGMKADQAYYVYDFWNDRYIGKYAGKDTLKLRIRPGESRVLSVRTAMKHPQVISTSRHIMQGYIDLKDVKWDACSDILSGQSVLVKDDAYQVVIKLPDDTGYKDPDISVEGLAAAFQVEYNAYDNIVKVILRSNQNITVRWSVKLTVNGTRNQSETPMISDVTGRWNDEKMSLRVAWHREEGYQYSIYRDVTRDFKPTPFYFLGSTMEGQYTDKNLQSGETYYYQIIGKSNDGSTSIPAFYEYENMHENPVRFDGMEEHSFEECLSRYGKSGYSLRGEGGKDSLPAYIRAITSNANPKRYDIAGLDEKQDTEHTVRPCGYDSNTGVLTYEIDTLDHEEHEAVLYCMDASWDTFGSIENKRKMAMEIRTTYGKVLENGIAIEDFGRGICIKIRFRGSFIVMLRNMVYKGLFDSVCSAIFFD